MSPTICHATIHSGRREDKGSKKNKETTVLREMKETKGREEGGAKEGNRGKRERGKNGEKGKEYRNEKERKP
jgi:hypothetical protein